ncbi:MAG: DUF2188 domain-containing protein [Bacilli bacterium]|nr:DUF2188 domain-containing protein [Bacilli bacterium]
MFKTKTSITVVEDDEPEPDAELETEEDRKKRSKKKNSLFNNIPRTYHISKQSTGKWQVKLASGTKAIKLFDTQAEAIAFAKELVHTQGGSIRIHSLKGKIRK